MVELLLLGACTRETPAEAPPPTAGDDSATADSTTEASEDSAPDDSGATTGSTAHTGDSEDDPTVRCAEAPSLDSCAASKLINVGATAFVVRPGGDLTGDGLADVLVSDPYEFPAARGVTYVLAGPLTARPYVEDAVATIRGVVENGNVGYPSAPAGDVDGDGQDDLLLGAPTINDAHHEGYAYVVPGPVTGENTIRSAWSLGGDRCDRLDVYTDSTCQTGEMLTALGDTDGDGSREVLLYAPGDLFTYLVRGPFTADVDLRETWAVRLLASAYHIADAGDLDGDGLTEFLVGIFEDDVGVGLIFDGSLPPDAKEEDASARYVSVAPGVSGTVGDVTGDGYSDLRFVNAGDDTVAEDAGAVWLVAGPTPGGEIDAPSAAFAKFEGIDEGDFAGHSFAALRDLDGDDLPELAIGAPLVDQPDGNSWAPGEVYVLFSPYAGTNSLASAPVRLAGDDLDCAGTDLFNAGDTDGDGLDDLIVTGPHDAYEGDYTAGAAWLLSGATLRDF